MQLLDSAQFTGYQKARLLQLRETYLRNVAQLAKTRAAYEVQPASQDLLHVLCPCFRILLPSSELLLCGGMV